MVYGQDCTARYVGLQRVDGSLGGMNGSFVVESNGAFDGGEAKGTWSVIPRSGTGDLAGLTGEERSSHRSARRRRSASTTRSGG